MPYKMNPETQRYDKIEPSPKVTIKSLRTHNARIYDEMKSEISRREEAEMMLVSIYVDTKYADLFKPHLLGENIKKYKSTISSYFDKHGVAI